MSDMHAQTIDEPRPRLITAREYERMVAAGVFGEDERLELLDGQLIAMPPPQGEPHAWSIERLNTLLSAAFLNRARVRTQLPMRLDRLSMPEPDFLMCRLGRHGHPKSPEVLLAIEVAESSLHYDRGQKLRAYARNGVSEYWIVDLLARRVHVSTEPQGEAYRTARLASPGETLIPQAFPDVRLAVSDFMPRDGLFAE
jgi:Uma2 family endonuclease